MNNKKNYREFIQSISSLTAKLAAVQEKAKNLGIFTESRDLLKCLKCGLMEDVLCDGRLVTYYNGESIHDTGLRFKHKRGDIYYCPGCGLKASLNE